MQTPATDAPPFTFVDLFAGIGGFHAALSGLGGECVYAVEVDERAANIYHRNWGLNPLGDVTRDANDTTMNVPAHEVLAAGFPCQPFSKSGFQRGMDETRGTLYWNILRIIEERKPKVVLLENVRNLAGPRHVHEWEVIIETLREAGYRVSQVPTVLSPHRLPRDKGGRPQARDRVFIAATHHPQAATWDREERAANLAAPPLIEPRALIEGFDPHTWDVYTDLPIEPGTGDASTHLSNDERTWIAAWDNWVKAMWAAVGPGGRLPGFPVWVDEWRTRAELDQMLSDPLFAAALPAWKKNFLVKNAQLFEDHTALCDTWRATSGVLDFPASRRKLEWQAQDAQSLTKTVLHFRPSGIRAKKATYLPALVAITQTSVLGDRRRISPREAARLQGLPDEFFFDGQPDAATYRQLGNGVNVGAVWYVLKRLAIRDADLLSQTRSGQAILSAITTAPQAPDDAVSQALVRARTDQAHRAESRSA